MIFGKKNRKRFGTAAVSKGFINIEQIIEALSIQLKENITEKKYRPIGEILRQLGYMNPQEIDEVLETRFEKRFGDISVSKGFIRLNQLIHAMTIQVKGDAKTGEHKLLGEILIEMGIMSESQVREVLDEM